MRLLLATQNFGPAIGGIEQYCSALARALVEEGASVTVLSPAHPEATAHDAAFPCDVIRYGSIAAKELGLAAALLEQRSSSFDAVVCLQWTSALLPALRSGTPRLAIVCHGKEVMPLQQRALRARAERLVRAQVLARADHVIAVSAFTAEHAIAAGARVERTQVVNPGVDAAQYAAAAASKPEPGARKAPLLLTVARLVERKGIDTVLKALPEIAEQHPGVRYAIAGEGADRARLDGLVAQLGLHERVEWLGYVSHAALGPLYASADLFVLPSRSIPERADIEGFGLVLLEAQACGTPVIGARSGGMPDAVHDGVSGVLVPPSDPAALARAASALLADDDKRAQMGRAALAFATSKTWRATARGMLDVLSQPLR
jgi:phosphatidylinositol alpha-1,6-mannosyltransferase